MAYSKEIEIKSKTFVGLNSNIWNKQKKGYTLQGGMYIKGKFFCYKMILSKPTN